MAYYKMSFVDKRISSPEEVLSSDVHKFAGNLSDIIVDVLSVRLLQAAECLCPRLTVSSSLRPSLEERTLPTALPRRPLVCVCV